MTPDPKKSLVGFKLTSNTTATAVVVGATTGIGAAVARKLALVGCTRIIILGRNEQRGSEVLQAMERLSEGKLEAEFVKGDISFVQGMKNAFENLKSTLHGAKVDYLVMCQNGPPTGVISLNQDGEGTEFTIQATSRFLLTYLFVKNQLLQQGARVMFVANPGLSYDLDINDLSLKNVATRGRYKPLLTIDQSMRDSTVLDSVVFEFNARYPQYSFSHVHPGLVKTELFNEDAFPFPLNYIAGLGLIVMGSTPDDFANIPVYLLVHDEAKQEVGDGKFWDHKLQPKLPGKWPSSSENRERLWQKLLEMTRED